MDCLLDYPSITYIHLSLLFVFIQDASLSRENLIGLILVNDYTPDQGKRATVFYPVQKSKITDKKAGKIKIISLMFNKC